MRKEKFSIAIDGPSGAGKSSVARRVADELGIIYVDTGALYRTVAVFLELCGIGPKDKDGVKKLLDDINIELIHDEDGAQRTILNGRDVTGDLRTPKISKSASIVSAHAFVRKFLLGLQREMAEKHSVVMDGRDIGTVILPNADVKIFLTADTEERAKRRFDEMTARGEKTTYQQVLADIIDRDSNDSTRAASPLVRAKDAWELDSTGMTLEQVVEAVLAHAKELIDR